jgi:CelD/BcsL family acetyltransferase involved in cellulose biosynthesis
MSGNRVEWLRPDAAMAHERAWRDLSARALEPNVFAEPAFVVSALQTIAGAGRLQLLLVWQDESTSRLIGAAALELPRAFPAFGVARVWRSEQAGLAALALDREAAGAALEAIIDWLAQKRPPIAGLLLPAVPAAGATASALAELSLRRDLRCRRFGRRDRAILAGAADSPLGFEAGLPKKRLKEWSRQMRRLKERGAAVFRVASDEAAVEAFLALEAKGWKGAQRTALGLDPRLAAFTRSMLAGMAREGGLAIHLLELDGAPLAAGVVLRSGERAYYWKTAYDESYAEYSPGVQLTLEISCAQQRDATIAVTDSCAIEGHPMIDRLWPARMTLVDYVISTRPGPARRVALWLAAERAKRRLREFAKRVINPLRGRKRS